MRIALGNHKGGSGKTTSTVQLAAALAQLGSRVLVVDMDPQANGTRRLGVSGRQTELTTTAEVVRSGEPGVAAGAIVPIGWQVDYAEQIRLIPSRFDLENRISEAAVVGAAGRLRRALHGADDEFDVVLLDCPPSLGHLTQLVLAAVQRVLITVEPEYDSVDGAVRLRDFVHTAAGELGNPELTIAGYLVTRMRSQLGAHAFQVEGLPDLFGATAVWEPYVPEWAAIKEASEAALPLSEISHGKAREAQEVHTELAKRIQQEAMA